MLRITGSVSSLRRNLSFVSDSSKSRTQAHKEPEATEGTRGGHLVAAKARPVTGQGRGPSPHTVLGQPPHNLPSCRAQRGPGCWAALQAQGPHDTTLLQLSTHTQSALTRLQRWKGTHWTLGCGTPSPTPVPRRTAPIAAVDTATSRNPCRPTSPGRVNCRLTRLQAEACETVGTRGSRMCESKGWGPSQSLGQSARDRHKCPEPVPLLATRAPAPYFTAQPSELRLAARETSSGSVASQDPFTSFRACAPWEWFPQSSHHNFTAEKFFRCIRKPSRRLTRRGSD